jgi:ribosomal protein L12E/L44/L45/RPP1/RPP2
VLGAIAAGLLAMEIAKIVAFVTGGTAAWLAAQSVMPEAHELWAVFLCGGLVGVVLYRLWTMLAASVAGVLAFGHAALLLAAAVGGVNAVEFAEKHASILNTWAAVAAVLGVVVQARTGREAGGAAEEKEEKPKPKKEEKKDEKGGEAWWIKVWTMKKAG